MSLNLFVANGRLVKDLELRKSQGGISNVRFTLAVNRNSKKDGQPEADFISCIAFNKTAELLTQYCGKGSKIGIQGTLQTGSYDKDGQKVFTTDILVNQIEFLDSKKDSQQQQQQVPQQQPPQQQFNSAPPGYTQQQNFNHQAPQYQQQQNYQQPQQQQKVITEDDLPF